MKYEKLIIIRVPADNFAERTIRAMEEKASFADTDEDLNEKIISVESLIDIYQDETHLKSTRETVKALYDEIKQFNYLMLTKI